jgi:uncharacterized protein DUF4326
MTAPQRIQRKRTKGWRMPDGAVYVGRPSRWGNPFIITKGSPQAGTVYGPGWLDARPDCFYVTIAGDNARRSLQHAAVRLFRQHLEHCEWRRINVEEIRQKLSGHDLACWCPLVDTDGNRVPCHADVLLEIANGVAQ